MCYSGIGFINLAGPIAFGSLYNLSFKFESSLPHAGGTETPWHCLVPAHAYSNIIKADQYTILPNPLQSAVSLTSCILRNSCQSG
jgi:hypothetical protein